MDILCMLHDSDEYGICRWPLAELARAAGVMPKHVKELVEKSVLKGGDRDVSAFTFSPEHGGKKGKEETLIAATDGPCWYSSRLVRDEWVRKRRGAGTRFTTENQPPTRRIGERVSPDENGTEPSPIRREGERQGYGPSSSSSSSSSKHSIAKPILGLEAALRQAAGWEQEPHPGLCVTGPIEQLIASGSDLERDVLPVVKTLAPKARSRSSWNFFVDAIADATKARLAAGGKLGNGKGTPLDWKTFDHAEYAKVVGYAKRHREWPEYFGPVDRIPADLVDDELRKITGAAANV